jgi:hypothetical protein
VEDQKLAELIRTANLVEARMRLGALLKKRVALATENYVRYCIGVAAKQGYDLLQGDIALVHPRDLPQTVKLVDGRDPVYALEHPDVIEGKMLLVRKHLKHQFLSQGVIKH